MIPKKIRDQLQDDPRMSKCCACGTSPVQWHHALTYSGKSLQEPYGIQPLCYDCHMGNSMKPTKHAALVSELCALSLGLKHLEKNYPKTDWSQRKRYLTEILKNYL